MQTLKLLKTDADRRYTWSSVALLYPANCLRGKGANVRAWIERDGEVCVWGGGGWGDLARTPRCTIALHCGESP